MITVLRRPLAWLLLVGMVAALAAAPPPAAAETDEDAPAAVQQAEAQEEIERSLRLRGASRFDTADLIARRAHGTGTSSDVLYLARGDVFADALAAGTLTDGAIALTPSCGALPASTAQLIVDTKPTQIIGLGGAAAICDETLTAAGSLVGAQTSRLRGSSRYETAVAIVQRGWPGGAGRVYVASGNDSPDAAVGGALSDGPVLLVPPTGAAPEAVRAEVARLGATEVIALGGTGAISDETLQSVADGRPTSRLAGKSRFQTAVAIAEVANPAPPLVYLARADLFADAIVGGALTDGPILLVPRCGDIPTDVADAIASLGPLALGVLGGPAAVCDEIVAQATALLPPIPGTDGGEGQEPILNPTARPVDDDDHAAILGFDGVTLVVDPSVGAAGSWRTGNVLIAPPGPHTPDGLLHRVVADSLREDGMLALTLEPSDLTAVFLAGDIQTELDFDEVEVGEILYDEGDSEGAAHEQATRPDTGTAPPGTMARGAQPAASSSAEGQSEAFGDDPCTLSVSGEGSIDPGWWRTSFEPNVAFDFGCRGKKAIPVGPATLTGTTAFGYGVQIDMRFTLPNWAVAQMVSPVGAPWAVTFSELEHLEFSANTAGSLGLTLAWESQWKHTWEQTLVPVKFPTRVVMAGPVPVVVGGSADLKAGASVSASAKAAIGYELDYRRRVGVRYSERAGFSSFCETGRANVDCRQHSGVESSVRGDLNGSAEANMWIGLQPTITLYGSASVYARPRAGIDAKANWHPPMRLDGTIDGYVSADVGASLGVFGLSKAFGPREVTRWSRNLWTYPGDEPLGPVTGADILVFGDADFGSRQGFDNLVSTLRGEGYEVTSSVELPSDISGYAAIFHVSATPPSGATTAKNQLVTFVKGGGGLYLTGERPCCQEVNDFVKSILDETLLSPTVTVGSGDDTVECCSFSFTSSTMGTMLSSTPHPVSRWYPAAPGLMSGVPTGNVVVAANEGPIAAAWTASQLHGTGRLAVFMDVNWVDPEWGGTSTDATSLMRNLAHFLRG